ncbi:unnamed protein product [Sphenostylis stenocarpa]|uniref:Uncharacterized protein n=1 Tax=Sphenostylis stenocarpa TaxID=92480 RepID=A0AA86SET3_9FABA|nr:unnamed protein product [Sphenostylis stenocarpa]
MLYITATQAKARTRPHPITDYDADSHNLYETSSRAFASKRIIEFLQQLNGGNPTQIIIHRSNFVLAFGHRVVDKTLENMIAEEVLVSDAELLRGLNMVAFHSYKDADIKLRNEFHVALYTFEGMIHDEDKCLVDTLIYS